MSLRPKKKETGGREARRRGRVKSGEEGGNARRAWRVCLPAQGLYISVLISSWLWDFGQVT